MKEHFSMQSLVGDVPVLRETHRQHTKVPCNWYAKGTLKAHQHTKGIVSARPPSCGMPGYTRNRAGSTKH